MSGRATKGCALHCCDNCDNCELSVSVPVILALFSLLTIPLSALRGDTALTGEIRLGAVLVMPQNRACRSLRSPLRRPRPDDLTHLAFCSVAFRSEGETFSLG